MSAPPPFAPGMKGPPPRVPPYQPPSNPDEMNREKERVTLLLEINNELIQHTHKLQTEGYGGTLGQQPEASGPEARTASEEYIRCMRCLSCNISYLSAAANLSRNRPGNMTLAGPAIMEPPADGVPALAVLYERLGLLFPGWSGFPGAVGATRAVSGGGPVVGGQMMGQGQGQGQGGPFLGQTA